MRTRKDERGFLQWPVLLDQGAGSVEVQQHHEPGEIWLTVSGFSGDPFASEIRNEVGLRFDRKSTKRLIAILRDALTRGRP